MIYVKGLKKTFGDMQVLSGVDMHIRPGEKVVIVGPLRFRKIHISAAA